MDFFDIFVILALLLSVLGLFFAVNIVPQGYTYTVERFGPLCAPFGAGARDHHPLL